MSDIPQDDTSATPDAAAEATSPETATSTAAPTDPLSEALAEMERWKDLAYRSQAELDNFRKRSTRDIQDARAYANSELLRSLLSVIDNFEMGLESARQESEKSIIFIGMSMVYRQIQEFLRDNGAQEVEAVGKPFDPNLHEALSQEASATTPEGTVLRTLRKGYKLKDRLLRPANVVVSSGPAAT
jgi:molecular chaperone GrpE